MYTYYANAAHGLTAYSSLNIDLNTGQLYKLSDLFTSRINYKPILEQKVREYIKANNVPLIEEYKGLDEDQQFYLTPNSLVLYYPIYKYTPYAYGLFQIPIPFKDILNLLGPVSPIQRLLK
nr:RsiV family protein [Clostridium sporogenes]